MNKNILPLQKEGNFEEKDKGKGLVFVVSSPSGGGKTSIVNVTVDSIPNLEKSVSCTTRPPRPGELNHIDYTFIDRKKFEQMIAEDSLLEWAEVYGNLYGTQAGPINENRTQGIDTIMTIEIQGARSVTRKFREAVTIFIQSPSLEILENRLRERNADSEEVIEQRLRHAKDESAWGNEYDYTILNKDFDLSVDELKAIIIAERCRVRRNSG